MREKIIATDKKHLESLIKESISECGYRCDLNHIDISKLTDISYLFSKFYELNRFNGDISKWDTSNIINMSSLFSESEFNGDISQWDVSKVTNMGDAFFCSVFNGDISRWDTSNIINMSSLFRYSQFSGNVLNWNVCQVKYMNNLFFDSKFSGDLSDWRPLKLENTTDMFSGSNTPIPYWGKARNNKEVLKAIESYDLFNKMSGDLINGENNTKKYRVKI